MKDFREFKTEIGGKEVTVEIGKYAFQTKTAPIHLSWTTNQKNSYRSPLIVLFFLNRIQPNYTI